jgi:sugar transferase (PEP-CTERM/EpsH1 system associated)
MTRRREHSRVRLLYLAHRLPHPPDKGERIRAFHQIRALAERGEVHLVCPVDEDPSAASLDELRKYCASVNLAPQPAWTAPVRELARLAAGAPRMTGTFNSPSLARVFQRVLAARSIDRILVSSLHVAEIARTVRDVPKAIDLVDVYSQLWLDVSRAQRAPLSWLSALEGRRLAGYEARLAREFDTVILSSRAEAELFRRTISDRPAAVVGNGVDLEYFRPAAAETAQASPAIVFTGSMEYAPNADAVEFFATEVFPQLRAAHPGVRFVIVGRNPTRQVRLLAREPDVSVTGAVPDVRRYVAGATAAVVPLRIARGIQNKVLEAMAMGVPVVATSTALAGLEHDPGDGARRADDPAEFVRELGALLADSAWRRHCATEARSYVERSHRWEARGALLGDILENMTMVSAARE